MGYVVGSEIEIPTPIIKLGAANSNYVQDLLASYLPTKNTNFLNHEPRYYLFMAKSKFRHGAGKKSSEKYGVGYKLNPAGFYHPTHQNGVNFPTGAFYNGVTQIPLNSEFDINPLPYKKTTIDFNPFNWVRYKNNSNQWIVPFFPDYGESSIERWKIQGKKWCGGRKKPRTALFYLCIGIKNPDADSKYPVFFGEPSNLFRLGFKVKNYYDADRKVTRTDVIGFDLNVQFSSVKRITAL